MYAIRVLTIGASGKAILRITLRTNLAIRTLMYCAVNTGTRVRKSDVASACNASENHLGQVIVLLRQYGFIDAARGRNGGLSLSRPANLINIGSVFRLFEAEMPFAECFGPHNTCPLVNACWLRGAIADAVEAFYSSLERLRLSDFIEGNQALQSLLSLPGETVIPARCKPAASADEDHLLPTIVA